MVHVFGIVAMAVLGIFIVAVLVAPIANLTNQITLNHTGFTPNANITATKVPGLMPLIQLFPIFFILIGLLFVAKIGGDYGSRNWSENEEPEEPELEEKPEHYYPPWNCANCAGPNPENHPMCQYCGEAYEPRAVKYS